MTYNLLQKAELRIQFVDNIRNFQVNNFLLIDFLAGIEEWMLKKAKAMIFMQFCVGGGANSEVDGGDYLAMVVVVVITYTVEVEERMKAAMNSHFFMIAQGNENSILHASYHLC